MEILTYISIFILGLILGSFINVLVLRLKKAESFVKGRSKCPKCHKKLGFWDLIPVLSFIFLKAKCRYCGKKISWQYPLVEITSALLLVGVWSQIDFIKNSLSFLNNYDSYLIFLLFGYLVLSLLAIFVYDLKYYLIPDKILTPVLLLSLFIFLVTYFLNFNFNLFNYGFGMIVFSGFFAVQYFISKGKWVGGGDIKLGLLLGLWLGFHLTLMALFISYISGAVISIILIVLKLKTRKDIIPFGPFLIAGSLIAFIYGQDLINWYLNLLLY